MTAAERHHATVQRYYRLKGKLLGLGHALRLRPLRAALPRSAALRLADGARHRAGRVTRPSVRRPARSSASSSTSSWIDAELRPGKRSGAFSSSAVPSVHPVHPDELHRQAARRDDAGPRTGPRSASVSVAAGRLSPVRHAADDRGDGQRLRRNADLPALAANSIPSRASGWPCCAARSRTASPRSFARWC